MEIPLADRAILFDLDDTLVRTGGVVARSLSAWCRRHELDLRLVLNHSSGMRIEDTVAKVAPYLDADRERRWIEEIEFRYLEDLEPVCGAVEFVGKLPADGWGIVTSSSLALARQKLDVVGMASPKTLITSESVANGKPHPEGYRRAAAEMGIVPDRCIVFEDADTGIEAALSAGCDVVGVGDGFSPNERLVATVPDFRCVDVAGQVLLIEP